jgi:MYXO-CTERM domain-containing protein
MSDQTVNGTIVSTTGDVVVITTDSGQRMTFTRDAAFTLPSGLVAGNRVTVTYRGADPSAYTVNRIVMVDNTTGASGTYGTTTDNTGTSTYSTSDTDLPGTASPVPLVGLLGALTLGAGAAIRAIRRR